MGESSVEQMKDFSRVERSPLMRICHLLSESGLAACGPTLPRGALGYLLLSADSLRCWLSLASRLKGTMTLDQDLLFTVLILCIQLSARQVSLETLLACPSQNTQNSQALCVLMSRILNSMDYK